MTSTLPKPHGSRLLRFARTESTGRGSTWWCVRPPPRMPKPDSRGFPTSPLPPAAAEPDDTVHK
eukprot:CAMPEP_0184682890 /NCGR_PEP_ID=MMETSP0312-20130426/9180_1 /TAXON_ID=31354 /ORGANISM="Compsopogon coeruleus, Strain SAG 36.94" /LENGTH=63 /DNA_ID=CAMNT_0027134859 /DNA_START=196 /DNA_END=384 /DNA_ORIENTATION=-